MLIAFSLALLVGSYILGSVPSGLLIVKLSTGKDIRQVESGRTGGTNAMRAAGIWAGIGTAIFDVLKAAVCVWLARLILPGAYWVHILAPVMAIIGHNHSVFLVERGEDGKIRFRGGAGGGPTAGGAIGLWLPSMFFMAPLTALILYFVGYASVATLSMPLLACLIFIYRAWIGASPWQYIFYGVIAELVVIWALRPNIVRLFNGSERLVGLRAKRRRSKNDYSSSSSSSPSS